MATARRASSAITGKVKGDQVEVSTSLFTSDPTE